MRQVAQNGRETATAMHRKYAAPRIGRLKRSMVPRALSAGMVVLCAVVAGGCATGSALVATMPPLGFLAGIQVHKGKPFEIIRTQEASGFGVLTHPYLFPVGDGRIMLTYFLDGDPVLQGTAHVNWPLYSDDRGRTWQFGDPMTWAEGTPELCRPVRQGEHFCYNLGYCFAYTELSSGERVAQAWLMRPHRDGTYRQEGVWSEGGRVWHGPRDVAYRTPVDLVRYYVLAPRGAELADGSLVCIGDTWLKEGETRAVVMFRSVDGGASYEYLSTVATSDDCSWGETVAEPAVQLLPNGELLCLIRTGGTVRDKMAPKFLEARSSDNGKTWRLNKSSIGGVMPKLLMMSNGVLVCATGRLGNTLYFSRDDGRSWGRSLEISPVHSSTTGYIDILEVEPGRLLAVYDTFDASAAKLWLWEPPSPYNAVWGVYVDVTVREEG